MKKIIIFAVSCIFLSASDLSDEVTHQLILEHKRDAKEIKQLQGELRKNSLRLDRLEEEIKNLRAIQFNLAGFEKKQKKNSSDSTEEKALIITAWGAKARKKPSLKSHTSSYYKLGDVILKYSSSISADDNSSWYETKKGYVSSQVVRIFNPNELLKVTPLRNSINVRKAPVFSKNSILYRLNINESVTVYPVVFFGKWYKLVKHNGYIYKDLVQVITESKRRKQ